MWTVISKGVSILLYTSQLSVLQYNVDSYQYWNFNFTLQESVIRSHQYAEDKSSFQHKSVLRLVSSVKVRRRVVPISVSVVSSISVSANPIISLLVFYSILKE